MFAGSPIRPLFKVAVLTALLPLAACATAGSSRASLSTPMPVSRVAAAPPAGFAEFCARMPAQCAGARSSRTAPQPIADSVAAPRFERTVYRPEPAKFNWNPVFADLQPAKAAAAVPTPPRGGGFNWAPVLADLQPASTAAASTSRVEVTVTPALWSQLETINQKVNSLIRPRDDVAAFGVADYWALPITEGISREGNCKHYALEKRQALIAAGVPKAALSVAVALTRSGEPHAVLVVATDRGDFVLDNLTPWLTPWRDTGYTWIERQAPEDPTHWVMLSENTLQSAYKR